jgi:hypothetical protein
MTTECKSGAIPIPNVNFALSSSWKGLLASSTIYTNSARNSSLAVSCLSGAILTHIQHTRNFISIRDPQSLTSSAWRDNAPNSGLQELRSCNSTSCSLQVPYLIRRFLRILAPILIVRWKNGAHSQVTYPVRLFSVCWRVIAGGISSPMRHDVLSCWNLG